MVPDFKCWSLCWCQKQLSKCCCCPGAPSLSCEPGPSGHYHTRILQGSSAEYMLTCPVSWAVRDPLSRVASSPHHGSYPAKIVLSTAVPLVAVSMALRRPIRPRVGIKYFSLQHKQGTLLDSGRGENLILCHIRQQSSRKLSIIGTAACHSQSLCLFHSSRRTHISCCTLVPLCSRSCLRMIWHTTLLGVQPQSHIQVSGPA